VNSTGNTTIIPWVQVVFVLETTAFDGVYDPTQGDYGQDGNNTAGLCTGPCAESDGIPFFVNNVANIVQGITLKNMGVTNSPHVTFSLVDYFSNYDKNNPNADSHDDGDGSEYNVDVSTFEPATTFASTVTTMATTNPSPLFGGGCTASGWDYANHFYCDSDFSDNFLQTSMITAIYGGLHGSGLGWVNNSTTDHVVVWMGSSLPRDPTYPGYWCATHNDESRAATGCPDDPTKTAEPTYTYGSGIVEPAGETIAGLATIAKHEHVLIDTIDLPNGMTELTPPSPKVTGDTDYVESTAGEKTAATDDVTNILQAGCDLAKDTGGSWEGPTPSSSGVSFTCSAAATGNSDGNLTDTWCAYTSSKGCWPSWSSNPSLAWALTNINFPPTKVTFNVTGWMKEDSFTFGPATGYSLNTSWMTFYCYHNGVDISSLCKAAANHPMGSGGYAWEWPYGEMFPSDIWSVSFNMTVDANYPTSEENLSEPVDNCLNVNWTGCPGSAISPYSQVFYENYTAHNYTQAFPPAYATVMASPNVPVLSSLNVSPSPTDVFIGRTQALTVTPTCTGGPCPSGTTYSWSITSTLGSLNTHVGSSVTFTAAGAVGKVGVFVNATLNYLTIQSSPDIITVFTLSSVSVSPSSASLTNGGKQVFAATPTCTITCPAGVTYTWTLSNAYGSLNSSTGQSVTFTAGAGSGNLSLFVNATLFSVRMMSPGVPIMITLITLSSVNVSPPDADISVNGYMNFTASPYCAAGPCPLGTSYTWTVTSGLGTLSSSTGAAVTFTAGPTNGSLALFVNATLNGVMRQSAPVHVFIAPPGIQLSSVSVSPSSGSIVVGGSLPFTTTVKCTGGTCPAGTTYSWSLTNSLGSLSSTTAASTTFIAGSTPGIVNLFVNASLNGTTRMSAAVPVTITAAIVLSSVTVAPSYAMLGTGGSQGFTATPVCSGGPCPSGSTFTWTVTSALGTVNPTTGSTVTFTAGSAGGMVALFVNATLNGVTQQSSAVLITITTTNTLSSVLVSPSPATLNSSGDQAFTPAPKCTGGPCPFGTAYSWSLTNSLATLNASTGSVVRATAGTAGGVDTLFVNATLSGVTVRSAPVTITILSPTLSSVSVSPSTANLQAGTKQAFAATLACSGGPCPSGTTYSWSLSNTVTGTLSANSGTPVTFTAGSSSGNVNLYVSATLNGITKTSSAVPITVAGTAVAISSVSVSPQSTSLSANGKQSFTAVPHCTGGACPSGVTYLWTLTVSSMGSINVDNTAAVVFTAGTTSGNVALWVNATLNGITVSASAVVTISGGTTTPRLSSVAVTVSPSSTSMNQGDTRVLVATPTCTGGTCPAGTTYSWSVTNTLGSLSPTSGSTVTFTAGNSAGTVTVFVNATLNGVTVISAPTTFVISAPTTSSSGLGSTYLGVVIAIACAAVVVLVVLLLLKRRRKKVPDESAVQPSYEEPSAVTYSSPPPEG
jgi:hypothetical protein